MLHDYMQYTYLLPTILVGIGLILLVRFYIKNTRNEDVSKLKTVSGYVYWLLAAWAFVLLALLMAEEVFQAGSFNTIVFKACWPLLLSLLVVCILAFIRKYRKHPGGILLSSAIIIAGYYSFIQVLKSLES